MGAPSIHHGHLEWSIVSIKLMSEVWASSPAAGTGLLVHLALADHANDDGVCWPSQETLAQKARCSVRHVRNVIHLLESQGYVTIEKASNGRDNHRYRLTFREQSSGDHRKSAP